MKTNATLGLFTGCFFAIVFVVMRERADRTFQSPGDVAYWLNLPELGAIPNARTENKRHFYQAFGVLETDVNKRVLPSARA